MDVAEQLLREKAAEFLGAQFRYSLSKEGRAARRHSHKFYKIAQLHTHRKIARELAALLRAKQPWET
jgi:hypothetical protein